jgi:hypothetical protein
MAIDNAHIHFTYPGDRAYLVSKLAIFENCELLVKLVDLFLDTMREGFELKQTF